MKQRITIAAGALIAGAAGYLHELNISAPVQGLILLTAGAILFVLDPTAASSPTELEQPPASAQKAQPPL